MINKDKIDLRFSMWNDRLSRFLAPHRLLSLPHVWRYVMALAIAITAAILRKELMPWMGINTPYNISAVAIVITAVLFGIGPGLFSVLVTLLSVETFVMGSLAVELNGITLVRMGTAGFIGVFLCWILHSIRISQIRCSQSWERLAAFAAATFEGVVESETGRIVDCNAQFAQMFGYEVKELKGMEITDLIAPEARKQLAAIYESRESKIELPAIRKDGSRIIVEAHGQPVFPNTPRCYIAIRDITERKQSERELSRIEWLLGRKDAGPVKPYLPPYGDVVPLSTCRVIRDAVGEAVLTDIVSDYLDLMDTSAAVYEKNGDYALGIFSSGWCRFMDAASRRCCGDVDNRTALACGKWHCHESCWTNASKVAIETGQPTDIECNGGIHLYAVPVRASGEIVGSINIGYGDPPRDPAKLQELSAQYGVSMEELREHAEAYESRPPFIIELAKRRLDTSARLIGEIIERKAAKEELKKAYDDLEVRVQERTAELARINEELEAEIAERKYAEETARRERQRLYDVLETLPVYVVLLTPDYHVPFANRFFEERFGESHGKRCFEYLFGLEKPCEICETYKVLKTNLPHHWEWTGPDGRNYDIYDFPFIDADGSPLIMEMGIDITEKKRAEEELRRAVAYNRSLLEASLDPLVTIGPDGRITDVNVATESITGSPRGELIGADFSDYFTDPEAARDGYRRVFYEGLVRDYPLEIRHADGYTTPVLYNATVYRDETDKVIGIFAAARDVTERRRAEASIERQVTIQNAMNMVFQEAYSCDTLDLLGRRCLHIAEELTKSRFGFILEINGSGRMDAITMSDPGWSECRIKESAAVRMLKDMEVRGIWGEVVRKGVSVIVNDPAGHPDRVGTPEGHPPITSFLGIPLAQADTVIGLIGLANKEDGYNDSDRDCMESLVAVFVEAMMRKRAEVEIKRLNEELEERVVERTYQLDAANREMEAFAYSVSHDLRAPLRAIDGFSQALLEDCRERLDETGNDYLRRVREASQRMGILIDDILALSRISRDELTRVPVDLSQLAHTVAEELRCQEPERNVEFVIEEGLETNGDPRLIRVVLENLLGNAWKFTGKCPVARIEFRREERDGKPVYLIRDDGAGFDMAYAGKLFIPFQRLHSQHEFTGSGIGLSLVERIIHRHGGMVWAEGMVERGATFYFTISV